MNEFEDKQKALIEKINSLPEGSEERKELAMELYKLNMNLVEEMTETAKGISKEIKMLSRKIKTEIL